MSGAISSPCSAAWLQHSRMAHMLISAANKKEDGTLEAAAISVGRDGITPPM